MRKEMKEIMEQLEQGVKNVFDSDSYKEYLDFMQKFYNYSVNNIILIMTQKPDATLVAGYKAWQSKFGRYVRKGEKGITILAPCQHKKVFEDNDGNEIEKKWMSFRAVKVFDVSQTDGKEIPSYVDTLKGDVEGFKTLVERLKEVSPVEVSFEEIKTGANGYFNDAEKRIVVRKNMSEQQTVKTLIHEIAHAILHNGNGEEKDTDRRTAEVQAESVAYTVCNLIGIDTSDYSFGYVAGWSDGKEVKELTDSMETIRKTAKEIYDKIYTK